MSVKWAVENPVVLSADRLKWNQISSVLNKDRGLSGLRWSIRAGTYPQDPYLQHHAPDLGVDPGSEWNYDGYLWDAQRESITGSIVTFVDDGRGSGSSVEHAWQLLHRAATRFQHLGLQVAIRKIRPPAVGCPPGAWAGMIAEATPLGIFKTVAQAKMGQSEDNSRLNLQ
eukprot:scaffold1352_cov144-Cylindrotheca_fusiformis.AAC.9